MSQSPETNEEIKEISVDEIKKLVSSVYVKAKKQNEPVDPDAQVYPIYEEAIEQTPWNVELWTEYITTMERNECDISKIKLVFEKALGVSFNRGQDFRDIWLVYLDCLRRHTDWSDEKQIASLDKTFDVCTQYLGKIPESDPELRVLKYWALIQAKHMNNIDDARELWEDIAQKHGLRHSTTCKFWTEYAEFERLYGNGDDDAYRSLLHRALEQTYDKPELICERLILFERQEGEKIDTLIEAQAKCKRVLARAEKFRKLRDTKMNLIKPSKEPKKEKRKNEVSANDESEQSTSKKISSSQNQANLSSQPNSNSDELISSEAPKKLFTPMLPRTIIKSNKNKI